MNHLIALGTSLASLALIGAIYYCNVLSSPRSWLRSDMLGMIFLSILTGVLPIALTSSVVGLWRAFANGIDMNAFVSAGFDLAGMAGVIATLMVFRTLIRIAHRNHAAPSNVTPLTPRPAAPRGTRGTRQMKKAA